MYQPKLIEMGTLWPLVCELFKRYRKKKLIDVAAFLEFQ